MHLEEAMTPPKRRERVEKGIYRRPDGKFEIGFRDAQGKQRWRVVDGGITAARAQLAGEHAKRARGERVAADPRLRLNAAADAWWDARVLKLRPATQVAYSAALKHLRREFGTWRLTDITPTDVARFVTQQQAGASTERSGERRPLKGWTVRAHLAVLSAVFAYAARHMGFVGTNPVSLLDRVERPDTDDESATRILDDDELKRLLAAFADEHRLVFDTIAETGARLSEALGIVWGDVDLEAETIRLTHQLGRDGKRRPLKTKRSRRTLEVTPALIAKLRALKLASPQSGPHDLVFLSRAGTPVDHGNIGGRVMARAVKRAGLEAVERDGEIVEPAPTAHDLRHTHASRLIADGWDIEEISRRLGHSSVATTMRLYVHEFDAAKRSTERRRRLSALYGGDVEATMEAGGSSEAQQAVPQRGAEVLDLSAVRAAGQ
jgi:integrase